MNTWYENSCRQGSARARPVRINLFVPEWARRQKLSEIIQACRLFKMVIWHDILAQSGRGPARLSGTDSVHIGGDHLMTLAEGDARRVEAALAAAIARAAGISECLPCV